MADDGFGSKKKKKTELKELLHKTMENAAVQTSANATNIIMV